MILIFGSHAKNFEKLRAKLSALSIRTKLVSKGTIAALESAYGRNPDSTRAIIAEEKVSDLPQDMWVDLLEGLAKKVPILLISSGNLKLLSRIQESSLLTWLQEPSVDEVMGFLDSCGALSSHFKPIYQNTIPMFNSHIASRILKANGFLAIVSIHAADFKRVALEYGNEAYLQLQAALQKILYEVWGATGAFRKTDILCRRSPQSNTFYILLERSRADRFMPVPGDLERLADRLSLKLENLMWKELKSASKERILPKFLEIVPRFIVSYASTVFNPCVDSQTTVERLFRACRDASITQDARMLNRQREFIQTLIQGEDLMLSHFQGVFDLRAFSPSRLKQLKQGVALKAAPDSIFAFEALTRLDRGALQKIVSPEFSQNVDFLTPVVLFARAEEVNFKLELDQACFRLAMEQFNSLPGKLLVNILPRNFYYLDELKRHIPKDIQIIFEVSESEAINNMSLIIEMKEKLAKRSFGIAIDDFGKGYAGVDRIIKIQPDVIKLDQIFVSEIEKDARMQSFVKGLVNAARTTNSLVLAEGVETYAELQVLHRMGIDLVQGFFLHRPESREQILKQIGNAKSKRLRSVA
ncbi:MAG: EAL domain-containing protein [Deltaproteobacteria bacterium]|nr:EAL domain-containing protein [Deltaproteobacteria bacterium]